MAIPLALAFLFFISIVLLGYGVSYILMWIGDFLKWAKKHIWFPLVGTACGSAMGMCAGMPGVGIGALFGLMMGSIFELIRVSADDKNWSNNGSWLGLPYEEGNNTATVYTGGNGGFYGPYQRKYEKPWVWKGFQTEGGPKEDDIRLDKN